MRTDQERVKDILDYIDKVQTSFDSKRYVHDEVYRYGLLKYLEIIGEASRTLQQDTRDRAGYIDWKSIIGFRNIAVHVYHDIDWDAVLDIINDLDNLREKINRLL